MKRKDRGLTIMVLKTYRNKDKPHLAIWEWHCTICALANRIIITWDFKYINLVTKEKNEVMTYIWRLITVI